MPRFHFNQLVKHERNIYEEGDRVTVTDAEAEYFASNGWGNVDGSDKPYEGEPILNPHLKPEPSRPIVPENPYDTVLEIQSGTHGVKDSNDG